jgi:serine/threonine-protein kinase HipA
MDQETLVYVDLAGTCPLNGRLWGPCSQKQGKRHLRIRSGLAGESCPVFPGAGSEPRPRTISHAGGRGLFAADSWGRTLMRRMELRRAEREKQAPRTLQEIDYLLMVDHEAPQGAIRFASHEGGPFLRQEGAKRIPPMIELPRLLSAAEHVVEEEDTDEDLRLLFAPGSSLGAARPKASLRDKGGHLAIVKFPRAATTNTTQSSGRLTLLHWHR